MSTIPCIHVDAVDRGGERICIDCLSIIPFDYDPTDAIEARRKEIAAKRPALVWAGV